jgi:HlyD family secretion protein
MKRILIVVLSILAIAALGTVLYWSSSSSILMVRTAAVKPANLQASINTNGKVEAERDIEVRAPMAGICRKILVREGDHLDGGQPILTIDDTALRAELAGAEAELRAGEADLRNVRRGAPREEVNQSEAEVSRYGLELESARKVLETNEWLLKREAISRADVEQSRREVERVKQLLDAAVTKREDVRNRFGEADYRLAVAKLEAARSKLAYLRDSIARSVVRAPVKGTLYQFAVKDGAFVNTGDLLGQVADLSTLRVRAYVDEPELGKVSRDAEVVIQWDGRPRESWGGSVVKIPSQVVPRGTRSVGEVLCSLQDPSGVLIPNLNVDVEIRNPDGATVPALERDAVFSDDKGHYVWVMRDGRASRVVVETGKSNSRMIEIVRGLSIGDEVVLPGNNPIRMGAKIRVIEESP